MSTAALVEAQIVQLMAMKVLLKASSKGLSGRAEKMIDTLIQDLREGEKRATSEQERAEFSRQVEALAKGLPLVTQGCINLFKSTQSGDPYAISGSVLDLVGSLVSTVGAVAGPPGAVAGALLGAILSVVSMILKEFIEQPPSLLAQIETIMRKIESERALQGLFTARKAIISFTTQAQGVTEGIKYTFDQLLKILNPTEGNTIDKIIFVQQWLLEAANQQLPLWGEVLALECQTYLEFKLSLAQWLPHILDKPGEDGTAKLVNLFNSNDKTVLEFLEQIKPAARNRGITWHINIPNGIWVRDVVESARAPWKNLQGVKASAMAVSKGNGDASPCPFLAIFALVETTFEPEDEIVTQISALTIWPGRWQPISTSDEDLRNAHYRALHPFRKKKWTYILRGKWPLDEHTGWQELHDIRDCYDIWAIPGNSPGEINVYTATGDRIHGYVHGKPDSPLLVHGWNTEPISGYKVGAVRVVSKPKPFTVDDPKILGGMDWVVYGLCEVSAGKSVIPSLEPSLRDKDHFEIQALFSYDKPFVFVPPLDDTTKPATAKPWDNVAGIGVDSVHLWVFRAGEIACATHTNVKESMDPSKGKDLNWMIYKIPFDLGNYDPSERIFKGLRDLSPCDDGTLTAVFQEKGNPLAYTRIEKDGPPRSCSATPRFGLNQLIIEGWKNTPGSADLIKTNGWVMDRNVRSERVQKQPIFCWPMIEGLVNALQQPPALQPLTPPKPVSPVVTLGDEYYLKHVETGSYLTKVYKGVQWYPTLGSGDRVKLKISDPENVTEVGAPGRTLVDGMSIGLVSAKEEELGPSGKRCDVLMAWTNPYLYYYYANYSREYQTWIVSLVRESGLVRAGEPNKPGSRVRLVNKGYAQFMTPTWNQSTLFLATVTEYSTASDWMFEKA